MMKTIIAFGASISRSSINRQFAEYAAKQLPDANVEVLDLNDYSVPIYSVDAEGENGIPDAAKAFVAKIASADALVISLAEHNGSYTAGFKTLFDWATRVEQEVWAKKPMLLLSTSPGARGGASVMQSASASFPFLGGNIVASFSLPSFGENFSSESGIAEGTVDDDFQKALTTFKASL